MIYKYFICCYLSLQLICIKCGKVVKLGNDDELRRNDEKNIRKTQLIVEDMVIDDEDSFDRKIKNARIVGGETTIIKEYPFVVSLQYANFDFFKHYCGGTVINKRCILTAAHCTYIRSKPIRPKNIHVLSAKTKNDLWIFFGLFQTNKVKKYINHPKYEIANRTVVNDISILILKNPLNNYEIKVFPIDLPPSILFAETEPWDYFTTRCKTLGWGTLQYHGELTRSLHIVDLPLISNKKCLEYNASVVTDKQICTLATEGGKDACQGDSGGPLICKSFLSNKTYQIGIVSFGIGCGSATNPGVWTRVDKYTDWITNISVTYGCSSNNTKKLFYIFSVLCIVILT